MSSGDVEGIHWNLVSLGLNDDEIALVDQFAGKIFPCPWLETIISGYFSIKIKDSTCWFKRNKKGNRKPLT